MIPSFLTADDRDRVFRTIRKLAEHDISDWALTGGLAVEMHIQNGGHTPCIRGLNDLDFITREFEGIPISLAGEFLFSHVHPLDPPGRTILQLIDGDTSLRVDVFRAYGATMSRTTNAELGSIAVRLISLEDLAARAARLVLDLEAGQEGGQKPPTHHFRLATRGGGSQG